MVNVHSPCVPSASDSAPTESNLTAGCRWTPGSPGVDPGPRASLRIQWGTDPATRGSNGHRHEGPRHGPARPGARSREHDRSSGGRIQAQRAEAAAAAAAAGRRRRCSWPTGARRRMVSAGVSRLGQPARQGTTVTAAHGPPGRTLRPPGGVADVVVSMDGHDPPSRLNLLD